MASKNIRSKHLPKSVTRRDILSFAAAGAGMSLLGGMGPLLRRAEGAPITGLKRLAIVYCYGGYDGLNLLVPKTNAAYYDRRVRLDDDGTTVLGDISIKPGETLDIGSADYGLHPSFVHMESLWADNDAAAVRMVGYPNRNLSHFTSQDIYSQGVRGAFEPLPIEESGWIARVSNQMNLAATGAVAVGVGRPLEVEGADTNPLLISSMNAFQFQTDWRHRDNHALRLEIIQQVLEGYSGTNLDAESALALQQGHDLAGQIQAAVQSYESTVDYRPPGYRGEGDDPNYVPSPARGLQDVARMIQAGFDGQVFFTGFGGWDTHGNQGGAGAEGAQSRLITRLDHAIGSFADDCKAMGVWDDTVVCVVSEFGRRNFINASDGTDHGHGNQFFLAGGGINGGLFGPDITEADVADEPWLGYGVDFRDILRVLCTDHLGTNGDALFPEAQEINTALDLIS